MLCGWGGIGGFLCLRLQGFEEGNGFRGAGSRLKDGFGIVLEKLE